jgi:hypothetical protein
MIKTIDDCDYLELPKINLMLEDTIKENKRKEDDKVNNEDIPEEDKKEDPFFKDEKEGSNE